MRYTLTVLKPAGVYFGVFNPFFNNTTVILPLPGVPPTGEVLLEMLKYAKADWAAMAPLILEGISKNVTLLDEISQRLKMVTFAGGSLPKVFGDMIATKIKLTNHIGSSESGPLPTVYRHGYDFERDWNYLQIHPSLGAKFDPLPGDVFELVWERSPEREPFQTVFTIYPDLVLYRTKDLFTPHPDLPNTWTHASRADDVIIFINGEKFNPIGFESSICNHPDVSAALMFGHQRFEAGLLIQPSNSKYPHTTVEKARFIQHIWPIVEEANSFVPGYAKISPSHICFTESDSPVLRTEKGSIRRATTLEQYSAKINQMYADVELIWTPNANQPEEIKTLEGIGKITKSAVLGAAKWTDIKNDDNFFDQGMDSLQVLKLVRNLRMGTSIRTIQPSTIYLHPTVAALALALEKMITEDEKLGSGKKDEQRNIISRTLDQYTDKIDQLGFGTVSSPVHKTNEQIVLLTGSTGSIGSYILRSLMQDDHVRHIYCLNRSADSSTLQQERNKFRDSSLPTTFPADKVTFLMADLSDLTLGLPEDVYTTIAKQVTLVIHNAWMVNFNVPLQAFDTQLLGVVNLCALCGRSALRASFNFSSSISAVMNFDDSTQLSIPESIITDMSAVPSSGYAESKYIAERLLDHAAAKLNLPKASILRLGQIAGASRSDGQWNSADWIHAMIVGSKALGALPSSLSGNAVEEDESIDWLPIDTAADAIVEISLEHSRVSSDPSNHTNVFHILNSHHTSWKALLASIITSFQGLSDDSIQVLPPKEWISMLRTQATALLANTKGISDEATEALFRANPALRLIDFFDKRFGASNQGHIITRWESGRAEQASRKLRSADAIDGAMMARWVQQWCGSQKM
jgi:thioester reductase-like protein